MLFLVVLSLALMALDTRVAALTRMRSMLAVGLLPLHYMVSEPIQLFQKGKIFFNSREALIKENAQLTRQQLLLKIQIQRLAAIESENNQLKALMHSSSQIQGKILIAQLLSVDSDPFIHQMLLDKGNRQGVFVGQPVLDSSGVMGKIIQTGPFTSRVLLINDPHSGLPAQVTRNGLRAIVMGDGYTGKLRVVNVTQTTDIRKGDILTTSGLGDHFPEGYQVGVVSSVIRDPGLQFANIIVEPSARLDRAKQVVLVWPNRQVPAKPDLNHQLTPFDQQLRSQHTIPPQSSDVDKSLPSQPFNKLNNKKMDENTNPNSILSQKMSEHLSTGDQEGDN